MCHLYAWLKQCKGKQNTIDIIKKSMQHSAFELNPQRYNQLLLINMSS